MRTRQDLQQMQALPLDIKVRMTQNRIRQWVNEYGEDGVFVSFSGGKDSTVLLHIAREMYPNIKAVYSDTGLEYPEIRSFVKTFDNVDWIKPKMGFKQTIEKYGYPFVSKEVSECVSGARKYLTKLIEEETMPDFNVEGGYDNKYRKLRGIGEYTKLQNEKPQRRQQSETRSNVGDADEGSTDKGEYP